MYNNIEVICEHHNTCLHTSDCVHAGPHFHSYTCTKYFDTVRQSDKVFKRSCRYSPDYVTCKKLTSQEYRKLKLKKINESNLSKSIRL